VSGIACGVSGVGARVSRIGAGVHRCLLGAVKNHPRVLCVHVCALVTHRAPLHRSRAGGCNEKFKATFLGGWLRGKF
jgi:hypothetical protein